MSDLISRADAMGAVQDHFNADGFKGYDDGQKMMDRIKALPSADAVHKPDYSYEADMVKRLRQAEAVQGEWLYRWNEFECSVCGEFAKDKSNFCPNCGAKMKGGDDE